MLAGEFSPPHSHLLAHSPLYRLVQLIYLPPLLGMLLTGVLLRNVPYIDVAKVKYLPCPVWILTV